MKTMVGKISCTKCKRKGQIIPIVELTLKQTQKMAHSTNILKPYRFNVEYCIAQEIRHLLANGIITLECCCGHGKEPAYALIEIAYHDKAIDLDYKLIKYCGLYKILLKSKLEV